MDLKGSKTEANLNTAFAGESMARNKYTFFAKQATKEGYFQIAEIFNETADNELAHAKIWYKILTQGALPGEILDTKANLQIAMDGEHHEWSEMYKGFAETAREEGFNDIAFLFEKVGAIEKEHDHRYTVIKKQLEGGELSARKEAVTWHCLNCGHLHVGLEAPIKCPVCSDPQGMFDVYSRGY